MDLLNPEEVFQLIEEYRTMYDFSEIVPISALNGNNVRTLLDLLKKYIPEGPQYYDDNQITNRSLKFMISELIREKVLHHTEEEIPHSINVIIETMEKRNNNTQYIQALVVTERASQKGILIGKQGKMLKKIGQEARADIEDLLGEKVFLDIWVKVQKDWRNKPSLLNDYGFSDL